MRSDKEFKSKVMRAANKIHNAGGCDAADMRRSSRFVEIKRQKGSIRKSGTMSICRRKGLRRHTAVEQSQEFMQLWDCQSFPVAWNIIGILHFPEHHAV